MKDWLRSPTPFGVWLATCLTMGLLFAGGFYLYGRLQAARVDAVERLCLRDNNRSQAELDFLKFDAKSSPALLKKARKRFTMEPSCRKYALRVANQPPPQPGAPKP